MNYRHIYHAGNFADVFKHVILTFLIAKLKEKDNPFCVLDTHAGIGIYNLKSEEHEKTKESEQGIDKLLSQTNIPDIFDDYLQIVRSLEAGVYPGSPYIIKSMLRENDRLVACELHKEDHSILKNLFYFDKDVAIHHLDGYKGMKAFLPFKEKRGLILIDPPFENENDYQKIIEALEIGLKRFRGGIFAIWYPIKNEIDLMRWHNLIEQINAEKAVFELMVSGFSDKLAGTGMLIINPPYKVEDKINMLIEYLQLSLKSK